MAISSYVGFLDEVAGRNVGRAAERATTVHDLIALHERLGCGHPALIKAIECVSRNVLSPSPRKEGETPEQKRAAILEGCMSEGGMPTR